MRVKLLAIIACAPVGKIWGYLRKTQGQSYPIRGTTTPRMMNDMATVISIEIKPYFFILIPFVMSI